MATSNSGCPSGSDRAFGPRVDPTCRSFDFTLQFEDIFFACLPAVIFLILLPLRIAPLLLGRFRQKPADRINVVFPLWSKLLGAKLAVLTTLVAAQLAFLALRARNPAFSVNFTLAADVLGVIATVAAMGLSFTDHTRRLRPSTLLGLYLSALLVLGTARTRTFWLLLPPGSDDRSVPAVATLVFALTCTALFLESIEKKLDVTESSDAAYGRSSHEGNNIEDSSLKGRSLAPEQMSGIWARTSFTWLTATFRAGYNRIIMLNDLPPLDTGLESQLMAKSLAATWDKYDRQAKHSLLRACFRAYFLSLLSAVIPRLCLTGFTFAQPFLVNATVTFVGQESPDVNYGKGLIGAWALVYLGIAVSDSIHQYQNFRFTTRVRGGLIALVYDRALDKRAADDDEITAMTLMSTDVERISNGISRFHKTWSSLVDIIIACWLLGLQMSVACLAPIILVLAFIAVTYKVSKGARTAQARWVERVQERLKVTSSFLNNMKAVKMLGLSPVMSSVVQKLRIDEIGVSKAYRKLLVWALLLSLTPINLAPVVTFSVYVIIAIFWKHESLLAAKAFTSATLISLLTTPVILFIQALPQLFQSFGSFERIQKYCSDQVIGDDTSKSDSDIALQTLLPPESSNKAIYPLESQPISLKGQSFSWTKDKPAVLKDLNVDFQRGRVTAVVGRVGSGKSALLNGLLGEMIPTSPSSGEKSREVRMSREAMAYCAQEPWLENKTARQNIIGVSPYNKKWYNSVICACGLGTDLRQFHRGDQTSVGSTGQNLSGGQKQRMALARAVYSRHRVVILDDVFSGMDSDTADLVASKLLGRDGLLKQQQTTVVLATHNKNIMALADTILVIEDGVITETGSPTTLLRGEGYLGKLGISVQAESNVQSANDTPKAEPSDLSSEASRISADVAEEPSNKLLTDLRRKHGDFSVYKYYVVNAGYLVTSLYVGFMTLWIFCTEFSSVIVNWWSAANAIEPNKDVGFYMGIYAMVGIIGVIGAGISAWLAVISIISNTATSLHADLLGAVVKAPFRFFASTDSGELLNRFSQDMDLIDMNLPLAMVNYTSTAISLVVKIVILAIFSQYLGAAIPFLAIAVYFLQRFYLRTSRQVRLLGIEARAPLYTHFGETTDGGGGGRGAATIRAFGWRAAYRRRARALVDDSQRPEYLQNCVQQWLAFVLDVLAAALAVLLVAVVVAWRDRFAAGGVGVSLLAVVGFSDTLTRVVQNWTKLESSVGAVARVRRFVDDTEVESETGAEGSGIPQNWPSKGEIQFDDVVASYGPDTEPVLRNISLSIQAGQHVAICGRTGSGKSSLLLALLRMLDESSAKGQIKIDGVDINTIQLADLRARINVVPQDPFFIPGSLRFNIDPFSFVDAAENDRVGEENQGDSMMRRALETVGLWDSVSAQGGLDAPLDAAAWSAGQRQLLCLARAMVWRWRKGGRGGILVLDEAMSNVDAETESTMQEIIDTEFQDYTVLSVMHRLRHVSRSYDAVVLLDSGKLLEHGAPHALMEGDTKFRELYRLNG
ncbi:ABC transporter [Hypoxylon sp. FL1284]|nr:ABC transporter [Hypoxylon sp. FL1284]